MTQLHPLDPQARARYQNEMVGHKECEQAIVQAWLSKRMHHGWIFSGAQGIGKATFAWRIAKFLLLQGLSSDDLQENLLELDENNQITSLDVDINHPAILRIHELTHTGILHINASPSQEISVNEIRKLRAFFNLKSGENSPRVILIDGADRMSNSSANALLKLLEEPNHGCFILLVTSRVRMIPATIRSRCNHMVMHPLQPAQMDQVLSQQLPSLEPHSKQALIALSNGSPGIAIDLQNAGGFVLYERLFNLICKLPQLSPDEIQNLVDSLINTQDTCAAFTAKHIITNWLYNLIRITSGLEPSHTPLENEREYLIELASKATFEQWCLLWENLSNLDDRAGNQRATWISLFIQWAELTVPTNKQTI